MIAARRFRPPPGRDGLPRLWLVSDARRLPDPREAAGGLPRGAAVLARDVAPELLPALARLCRAAGFVLMLAVPRPEVAIAGLVLVGLGLSNVFPVLFSAAGRIPGVSPGMGVAMVATMGYGGLLGGPPLLGFLAQLSGLRLALCLLVLTCLAIAWRSRAVRRDGEA
ncbi:hypothetical protein ROMU108268_13165 [Roseomonas mucosa]